MNRVVEEEYLRLGRVQKFGIDVTSSYLEKNTQTLKKDVEVLSECILLNLGSIQQQQGKEGQEEEGKNNCDEGGGGVKRFLKRLF